VAGSMSPAAADLVVGCHDGTVRVFTYDVDQGLLARGTIDTERAVAAVAIQAGLVASRILVAHENPQGDATLLDVPYTHATGFPNTNALTPLVLVNDVVRIAEDGTTLADASTFAPQEVIFSSASDAADCAVAMRA